MIRQATMNLKKHKKYHGLFFLLLMGFFIVLFLSNALVLSLETLKEQPVIAKSFTPFLEALIQNDQKIYYKILAVTLISFFILCFVKTRLRKDETRELLRKDQPPFTIALTRTAESLIVFAYLIVSFLICLLIFQSFFERLLIQLHVLMTERIHNFPHQLEKVIQTNPEEQFVIRATNTKQIFEYLLYLPQKSWTRLFLLSYLKTIGEILGCFISISFLLPWIDASWKNKNS